MKELNSIQFFLLSYIRVTESSLSHVYHPVQRRNIYTQVTLKAKANIIHLR